MSIFSVRSLFCGAGFFGRRFISGTQKKRTPNIPGPPSFLFFLRWHYPDQVLGVYSQAILQTTSFQKRLLDLLKKLCLTAKLFILVVHGS